MRTMLEIAESYESLARRAEQKLQESPMPPSRLADSVSRSWLDGNGCISPGGQLPAIFFLQRGRQVL